MKKAIPIYTLAAIFLMIFATSCTKDSSVITTPTSATIKGDAKNLKKLMNIILMNEAMYEKHDEHDYAEGHILEFSTNWKLLKAENTIKIQNALAFMQTAVLTGDTTGQYLNLFTYVLPSSVFMDTYPDSALVYGNPSSYNSFMSWFQTTCEDWMNLNGCSNIVVNTNKPKYIMKIHCEAQ
ncbi:MAG TPA: hypothetical protein VE978_20570 [Chitinophagales bacterium]|nr:hypothetical protein [Chitinophagales bacterium]